MLIDDRTEDVEPRPVTIQQLRGLSRSIPVSAPMAISYEKIASRNIPRTLVAAGQGVIFFDFSIHSYRITFPNLKTIMVDSGLSAVAAKKAGFDHYDPAAQARVSKELKNTQMVVFLSDNDLHIGGLRPSGLEQPTQDSFKKMDCPEPRAIVPGIVEIPICDNVIASRMVYVRLDDRREFLLAGDIAPTKESARYQAGPSRYMNRFIHDPGRVAIHSWLKTIKCLTKQAPQMIVIPGHAPLSTEDMPPSFQKRRTP